MTFSIGDQERAVLSFVCYIHIRAILSSFDGSLNQHAATVLMQTSGALLAQTPHDCAGIGIQFDNTWSKKVMHAGCGSILHFHFVASFLDSEN